MLIGEYRHTLDSKNRLSLPARFRKELGKEVVITRGLENCLFLFSQEGWRQVVGKLERLPLGSSHSRGLARFILAGAHEVEVDRAGRILIPEPLKVFAGLRGGVVVAGVAGRIELWQEKAWGEYRALLEQNVGSMAQALGEADRF